MNIQFSIQPSDPLHPPSVLTPDQWAVLTQSDEPFIIERDEDCPVGAFIGAIDKVFPDLYLPRQGRNPRYYRVNEQRKAALWCDATFNRARANGSVEPCDHLFRVNRHGEIYAYEVPK